VLVQDCKMVKLRMRNSEYFRFLFIIDALVIFLRLVDKRSKPLAQSKQIIDYPH
jgi:hypothetical protein